MDENTIVYGIINNIPNFYHSSDLRNFFSQFLETGGFKCFHFRHRPEKQIQKTQNNPAQSLDEKKTFCCVFRTTAERLDSLIKQYNRKHWIDKNGDSLPMLCFVSKVTTSNDKDSNRQYKNRAETKQIPVEREDFTESDLEKLPELHPPDVMPNGNVGTPTRVFLELIQQCRLPPVVIKKLGLTFPKTRTNKKYGDVPYDYGGKVIHGNETEEVVRSAQGHEILTEEDHDALSIKEEDLVKNQKVEKKARKKTEKHWRSDPETKKRVAERIEEKLIGESDQSEEDNDSCEEWERHEALHDDPDNQERNDERLFESEIELKWEKGGSGLVFYTDAQHWKEQEGDFDEQTSDDWDIDMSAYYEKGAGDKDIKDFLSIRQSERWRNGTDGTDRFSLGFAKRRHKNPETAASSQSKIGKFEVHTKGIGRRVLEKQGWKEGQGIGSSTEGLVEALENEGQPPSVKTGLGYRGEKLSRQVTNPRKAERDVVIGTVYDRYEDLQKTEPLLRRHDHYTITYKDPAVKFHKAKSNDG